MVRLFPMKNFLFCFIYLFAMTQESEIILTTCLKQAILVFLIWASSLFGALESFPNGPPNTEYVCQEMFPVGHQANAQFSKPPYEIQLTKNMYTQGQEKIRVTVQALHGYFIGGFFIQARVAGNCGSKGQKQPVGVFELLRGEQYLKPISCNNRLNSSLSHRINRALDHAVFNWYAPSIPIGHVYFVATVVKEKTKFWTTVYSEIVRDTNSTVQPEVCPARVLLDPDITNPSSSWTTPSTTTSKGRNGGSRLHLNVVYAALLLATALCLA